MDVYDTNEPESLQTKPLPNWLVALICSLFWIGYFCLLNWA